MSDHDDMPGRIAHLRMLHPLTPRAEELRAERAAAAAREQAELRAAGKACEVCGGTVLPCPIHDKAP